MPPGQHFAGAFLPSVEGPEPPHAPSAPRPKVLVSRNFRYSVASRDSDAKKGPAAPGLPAPLPRLLVPGLVGTSAAAPAVPAGLELPAGWKRRPSRTETWLLEQQPLPQESPRLQQQPVARHHARHPLDLWSEAATLTKARGVRPMPVPDIWDAAVTPSSARPVVARAAAAQAVAPLEPQEPLSMEQIREGLREVLLEKCGCLDHAFAWLDFNSRGHVSRFEFDTGLRVLNLEAALKAVKAKQIFQSIDVEANGQLSLSDWRAFFGYHGEAAERPQGARGARLLRKVKHVTSFIKAASTRTEPLRPADDSALPSAAAPRLPRLEEVLEMAGEEEVGKSCSQGALGLGGLARRQSRGLPSELQEAEAMQIEMDVEELGFTGVRALAYILTAKCGSLDKAFEWLDFGSKGAFGVVAWETAVQVMHLDVEAITGVRSREIFGRMAAAGKGRVTKKQWEKFFAEEMSEEDWARLRRRQDSYQQNVTKVLKRFMSYKRQNPSHGSRQFRRSLRETAAPEAAQEEPPPASPAMIQPPAPPTPPLPKEAPIKPPAVVRARIGPSRSGTKGAASAAAKEAPQSEEKKPTAPPKKEPTAPPKKEPKTRRPAPALPAAKPSPEPASATTPFAPAAPSSEPVSEDVDEVNDAVAEAAVEEVIAAPESAEERLRRELTLLQPDEGRSFSNGDEQQAFLRLASELGLELLEGGQAVLRRGPRALEIEKKLNALPPGERLLLSDKSPFLLAYGQQLAEGLGYLHRKPRGGLLEVTRPAPLPAKAPTWMEMSYEAFVAELQRRLQQLPAGEVLHLPPNLGHAKDKAVRMVAREFNLSATLLCEAGKEHMAVGSLPDLEALLAASRGPRPGEKQLLAADVSGPALQAAEEGVDSKILPAQEDPILAEEPPVLDEATMKKHMSEIFERVSSGRQGRSRFLRKGDLTKFLSGALDAKGRRGQGEVLEAAEQLFDDVLELQVDMGSRVYYGITMDFFQVFLSRTAHMMGKSLMGLLWELLAFFRQPAGMPTP